MRCGPGNASSGRIARELVGRGRIDQPGSQLVPKAGHSNDETQHLVKLTTGYWLGKYEVTQGQWVAVMEDNPSNFQEAGKNAPVEKINWKMANEFCRKVTEREGDEGRLLEGFDV